jgi:hypothetical protein
VTTTVKRKERIDHLQLFDPRFKQPGYSSIVLAETRFFLDIDP